MRTWNFLGRDSDARSRPKRRPRRGTRRPTFEALEARRLLALGLFIENFSDDLDPGKPGFDSWDGDPNTTSPDEFLIPHQVSPGVFIDDSTVLRNTGDVPSPPYSLLIPSGPSSRSYTIDFDSGRGQPGGLGIDEEVASVAIRYSGLGRITFTGSNGSKHVTAEAFPFAFWKNLTVTSNSPSDAGGELGDILRVEVTPIEGLFVDDVAVLVLQAGFSNNPPVANPDTATTRPDTPVEIDVLANDGDFDGDPITLTTTGPAAHGSIQAHLNPTTGRIDRLIYTPAPGFHGFDTFDYSIIDGRSATAVIGAVAVLVDTPPPAPIVTFDVPHGYAGPFTVAAPGILEGVVDADGDPLTVELADPPSFGTVTVDPDGSFTYVPTAPGGLVLDDAFQVRLGDGLALGEKGLVILRPPNAPPELLSASAHPRRGVAVPFDGVLGIDPDGDPLRVEVLDPPRHGDLTFTPAGPDALGRSSLQFRYVPAPDGIFRFNDRFTYRLLDGYNDSSGTGVVTVMTTNSAPVARDDAFNIITGPTDGTAFEVRGNDSDDDDDPLTATVVSQPLHGHATIRADGLVLYEPHAGFTGSDLFTYRVTDGDLESDPATVMLEVVEGPHLFAGDDFISADYSLDDRDARLGHADIPFRRLLPNDIVPVPFPDDVFWIGLTDDGSTPFNLRPRAISADPRARPGSAPFRDAAGEVDGVIRVPYPGGFVGTLTFHYFLSPSRDGSDRLQSHSATVTVQINDTDRDGDGAFDSVEDRGGFSSSLSATWARLPNAVDGKIVNVLTPRGVLRNVRAEPPPPPGSLPPGVVLPIGVIRFEVAGLTPGDFFIVSVVPEEAVSASDYYKFGPEDGGPDHWYSFDYDHATNTGLTIDWGGFNLWLKDGLRGDDDLTANGVIVEPGGPALYLGPPRVARVVIDDGEAQRSKVGRVAVTFNDPVTLDPGAIRLVRVRGSRQVPIRSWQLSASVVDGRTVAELRFARRRFPGGSLRDGTYRVVIRGDRVRDLSGLTLDGDSDGVAGGDFTRAFRRRFGDGNGDGVVDRRDWPLFRRALGKRSGEPGFAGYFDARGDGRVGPADLARFVRRFRWSR